MFRHLYEIVPERASKYPAAIALGSREGAEWRTLDSLELLGTASRLAEELATRGVREGDRVVLWLPSSWRSPVWPPPPSPPP